MIELIITTTTFSIMIMLFKYFDKIQVNNLIAITFNYFTAGLLALMSFSKDFNLTEIQDSITITYIFLALLVGLFFVVTFNLYAYGTQKIGITISTISNKMSMIIPILIGLILFKETITFFKILGIILAIGAIIIASKEDGNSKLSKKYLIILLLLFLGQGMADGILNWTQKNMLSEQNMNLFFGITFLAAGLIGSFFLIFQIGRSKVKFDKKSIVWGILLGIPNYLTLLYFIKSLKNGLLDSFQIFPIVNMGVIILCTVSSILIFNEKVSLSKWVGIGIGVLAIFMILL